MTCLLTRAPKPPGVRPEWLHPLLLLALIPWLTLLEPRPTSAQESNLAAPAIERDPPPAPAAETNVAPRPEQAPAATLRQRSRRNRPSYEDIVQVGSDATLAEGQHAGDVVVVRGKATIDGVVHGGLCVVAGVARLGPQAEVGGDVVVVLGVLDADPKAVIKGERTVIGVTPESRWFKVAQQGLRWFESGPMLLRPLPHAHGWSWVAAGIVVSIYVLLALLFPGPLAGCAERLDTQPGRAFLVGLLTLVLLGPALVLLSVTVIGLILVPFLAISAGAAYLFGKAAVYRFAGGRLGSQLGLATLQRPITALLLGALLFCLVYTVPVVGLLAWCAVAPLGMGAVVLVLADRLHRPAAPGVALTAGAREAAAGTNLATAGATAPAADLLPRVGFWARFLATLLDFALVATVVALLDARRAFLPIWVIYHMAMWAWRGTTVGGIVLGLKIVRTDGSPLSAPVAVVRALAAFFSALVLFLGFFWAGWSRDRQSWHDRIAGTLIVRMPKGSSLV